MQTKKHKVLHFSECTVKGVSQLIFADVCNQRHDFGHISTLTKLLHNNLVRKTNDVFSRIALSIMTARKSL